MIHALKSTLNATGIELQGCMDLVTLECLEKYSDLIWIDYNCIANNHYNAERIVYFSVFLTKEGVEGVLSTLINYPTPEWKEICNVLKEVL